MQIDPEEILDLFNELNRIPDPSPDWFTTKAMVLIRRYPDDPDRALCIFERVDCIRALLDDERMRPWVRPAGDPDHTLTHKAVFAAVAKCPISLVDDNWRFDPDDFFRIVLLECDDEAGGPQ